MSDVSNIMIKDFPEAERPREKLLAFGAKYLSHAELIAIILRTGNKNCSAIDLAERIIGLDERGLSALSNITHQELMTIKGIGSSKACQILAAIELGNRIYLKDTIEKVKLNNPESIMDIFMRELRYEEQEHFWVVLIDTKCQMISKEKISTGTLNASIVHPRDVFKWAIRRNASSIICVHNHPSGNPTPSVEDVKLTERLVEAGKLIGIQVVDHVIIGDGKFYSFKAESMI